MNSKVILGLVVAALVAVGGVFLFAPEKTQDSTSVSSEQEVAIDAESRLTGTGMLTDLFGSGGSLICNYSSVDDTMQNEGTMYYDADKERYQMRNVMTDASGVYQSGMVNDGTTIYTWSESAEGTFAYSFPVANMQANAPEDMPATPPMMEEETQMDESALSASVEYDCVPWTVDESIFVPPANLEFVSPEDMFLKALESMGQEPMPMGMPVAE